MRWLAAIALVPGLVLTSAASAQNAGPLKTELEPAPADRDLSTDTSARIFAVPKLRLSMDTSTDGEATRPIDLFPPNLYDDHGAGTFMPFGQKRGKNERRRGLTLGADTSWKKQAAQVGAMAVGFAVLSALCKGGGCTLGDSWLPGPLKAKGSSQPVIGNSDARPIR